MSESVSTTARARARIEITREIKATARRHLAESGASGLSLRAVARELGLASSALYRYFPSRDALLTALIVDAFDSIGEAAETALAEAPVDGGSQWRAVCHAVRRWALDNPHGYALVYGSPVPGYVAPVDTVGPATRVTSVLIKVLTSVRSEQPADRLPQPPPPVAVELSRIAPDLPPAMLALGMGLWGQLFGLISLELFGHLDNVISDRDAFFDHEISVSLSQLGLMP